MTSKEKIDELEKQYGYKNEEMVLSTIFGEKYVPDGTENKFIKAEVFWGYCSHCRHSYLKCPKCGNNSCNAGYGRIWVDVNVGIPCDLCKHMYELEKFLNSEYLNPQKQDFLDLTIPEPVVN